jgi:hypothetical protein
MNITPQDQDRIERYLLGQMLPAEATALEADCTRDPALAEALAHERDVQTLARASRMLELRESLQAHARSRARRPKIMRFIIAVSAAAAVFLVVYIGFVLPQDYSDIALAQSRQADSNRGSNRGGEPLSTAKTALDSAEILLDSAISILPKDPRRALPILRSIHRPDWRSNPRTKGICHEAGYHLGLAYAQQEMADSAQKYLEDYVKLPDADHKSDAQKILQKL